MSKECSSCAYNISILLNKPLCSEGITREYEGITQDIQDCRYYSKRLPIEIPTELKNIVPNPFNYWHLVPRYVRGILPHESLVLSDRGLCIFHSPNGVIRNEKGDKAICPKLLKHLRKYIMSFSNNKRVKDLYVYLMSTSYYNDLYIISSNKSLRQSANVYLNWEYSNNVYTTNLREGKHVGIFKDIPIYLPYIVNKVEESLIVLSEL